MIVREYKTSDCKEITELFYDTVHTVNRKDYTDRRLDVWAPENADLKKWDKSLSEHYSLVAVENDIIIGFGDMDRAAGYLDRLYVDRTRQGEGIATAICDALERGLRGEVTVHASITAKPFFEKRGYKTVSEQQVERGGIFLTNFIMIKQM